MPSFLPRGLGGRAGLAELPGQIVHPPGNLFTMEPGTPGATPSSSMPTLLFCAWQSAQAAT
ncbi:hypothetical protein [Nodosilinea sp. PGN35]|uniref:hypothetical protein n=1 Tax=Nodosilinea sp. PGN35 TaxID=3020489 RepID=UPI0023B2AC68|nr:hypothetical protein [Nodosilinea sp. TSF1-S3]MDF0369954.1 hypothetical protein [Nodosilinea sp. TSF1-S3]